MALQLSAKERLMAKADTVSREQQQVRESIVQQPDLMAQLRQQEAERQAKANAARVREQRSGSIDPQQVNRTPMQDRARMTRENSQYRLGDVRSKQGRVGAAAQSIGLNTAASVQYLGETAKQAVKNTREYMQTQEAEAYAQAVSDFNRVRQSHWEGTPEYQAAYDRVQEARGALEETSREVRSQTVDPDSKGSQMMAKSQELKEKALEGTTGATRFLGETAMSVTSNVAKLPLGAAAPVLMGAEAAANKAYELQQQGVGAGQAMTRGITSGVIEGITEKMGLDNLFDLVKTGGKTALKNVLKQAGVEGTEEGFSYVFNLLADKVAKDPNAKFDWNELLQSIASGAVSGLFFGAGGTAVNRMQSMPDVIVQTGKEKNVPTRTSLHLADGQVHGLPMVEKPVGAVQNLPLKEQENGQTGTEPASLPVRDVKTPKARERAMESRDSFTMTAEPQSLPMVEKEKAAGQSQTVEEVSKKTARAETAAIVNKLKSSVPDLADMSALSIVKGTEFNGEKGKLTETVGEFFRSIGGKIFRKGFGDVLLTSKSIKTDISHGIGRAKAATFAAVPDIIANGRQIDYQQNWKGRGKDSYVFAGPVEMAGKRAYVAAVVLKDADNRFYLHEVVDEDGNVIFMKKDATWEGQDRNYRQNGITEAQEASTGAYQVSDAGAPDLTAKTELELTPNSSIRESGVGVKPDPVEPQTFPMREIKTPNRTAPAAETRKADILVGDRRGNPGGDYWELNSERIELNGGEGKNGEPAYIMNMWYKNAEDPTDKANLPKGTTGQGVAQAAIERFMEHVQSTGRDEFVAMDLSEDAQGFFDHLVEKGVLEDRGKRTFSYSPKDPQRVFGIPKAAESQPTGLPMKRREEIQDALTAGLNGGRTLGDNEARTGLPLPTEVESQLQALEALTTPMEDGDDVANTIRKYMGEEAALYWLEHKNDDAEGGEDGDLFSRPTPDNSGAVADEEGRVVGTQATEKLGVRVEGGIADMTSVQKARQAQWGLDVALKQIQKAEKDLGASAAEKRMAESIAKGQDTLDSFKYGWDGKENRRRSVVEELSALYRMRDLYDKNGIKALGRKNKDVFIDTLNREILNHVEDATPPGTASLHTNTWERNNLRTWGRELGEKVNQLIFDPIRRNEANRIRWLDQQATDMKILGKLTDAENEAVFDMLDNGKETAAYDGVRNEVVQEAADKLKTKYAQYYDAINDVLVAHGYPEIGFIKNYAPHKQPEQMKSAMSIFEKLGLSDTVIELPTELAGRTDIFKPGKKWNPHFLHRAGDKAALDAVGGYMSYLNYMSEVLFHVDDIQKVRTFGDQIRYLYGDEGLQADYDAVRADKTMNEQEKELELARIRERQTDNSKMGAYVTQLDDYANILAGKQTMVDRAIEKGLLGRVWLNTMQKPIQILVQSSIPGNLSSAINQTVQLPWLMAEAGEGNVLQAVTELARGKLKRSGFAGESDFITGKRGAENFNKLQDKTTGEKVLDVASIPFEVVDDAASQIIVRAFYLKNVKAGMTHEAALRAADTQAEKLVGSRMKGSKANIFSDKSLKLLTTFQLEVANQWQHLKFDLPQEYREIERTRGAGAAKAEAVKRIVKGTVYTAALNALIEQITGSKPAGYDIIGAIWDYIQAGLPDEDEEEEGFDFEAGAADLRDSMVDDLPFVGTIATLMGYGDGRLPLPEPDLKNLKSGLGKIRAAETDEEKAAGVRQLLTGVLKTGSAFAPMGNQIRKTIEGGETAIRGGRYTNDGTQLMYEVESSPQNIARGLLFGRNALPETREYWENGGKAVLSGKQTGLMEQAKAYGIEQSTYVDFVTRSKALQSDKDDEGNTISGSLAQKKIDLIDSLDITDDQKLQLYLDNVASDSKREDAEALRSAGMTWDEIIPALGSKKEQQAAVVNADQISEEDKREVVRSMLDKDDRADFDRCISVGASAADFVQTKDFYNNTYADKDKNGKSISGSKKKKVWNYINGLQLSKDAKDALSIACGYDAKLDEAPWHNGVLGLPMMELPTSSAPVLELPSLESGGEDRPVLMLP